MDQASLFSVESELDKRFREFDDKNPKVYIKLLKMTKDLKDRGHSRIGIGMLFEVIRWQTMLQTVGDPYRLNNSYRSRYVRKIAHEHPEFANMFETRELRS